MTQSRKNENDLMLSLWYRWIASSVLSGSWFACGGKEGAE